MQQLTNLLDNGLRQALGRLRAPAIAVESIVIGFVIGFGSLGSSPLRFGQRYVAIGHRLETQVLQRLHAPQQIGHERDAAHLNDELVGDAAVAHHVIAEQQYDDGQHQQALPHLLVLQVGIVVAQPSAVLPHGALQSGLLRSCSMQSSTTMARGTVSRQSSSAPMSIHSVAASPSAIMVPGRYHRWPSATMPKNAAVHRRSRLGVDMRRVKALHLRSKRYTQATADTVAPTAYSINSRMTSRVICSNIIVLGYIYGGKDNNISEY